MTRNIRLDKIAKKIGRWFHIPQDYYVALHDNNETDIELMLREFQIKQICPKTN